MLPVEGRREVKEELQEDGCLCGTRTSRTVEEDSSIALGKNSKGR